MKYTTEEALAVIMQRRNQIILRRDRRACRMLSGAAGALFAVLVLVIALLSGKATVTSSGSVYGSFLLSQEAGGLCAGGGDCLRAWRGDYAAVS